jgi:hypothetical protein
MTFPRSLTDAEADAFSLRHGIYLSEQRAAGLRICQITPTSPGRFSLGGPVTAYVLMTSPDPEAADIVAFRPEAPTRWRTLKGAAWLFGRECEPIRFEECGTVRLWRDPMAFLRNGAVGAVMLSSGAAVDLTAGVEVVCQDEEHAKEVRRMMWRCCARVTA